MEYYFGNFALTGFCADEKKRELESMNYMMESFVGIMDVRQITVLSPWKTDYQPDMIADSI